MLPPVAQKPPTVWSRALDAEFAKNNGTERPKTIRALAKALAMQKGSTQTAESWRRSLTRMPPEGPTERVAILIAEALEVPRKQLPKSSQPLTLRALEQRIARLELQGVPLTAEEAAVIAARVAERAVGLALRAQKKATPRPERGTG